MEKLIQLTDDEVAAVAGAFLNFTNSLNGNLASFALQ
jgi:hypothetical protein